MTDGWIAKLTWAGVLAAGAVAFGAGAPKAVQSIYSFSLVKPGGTLLPLADFKGKVLVIVNVASKSTFAAQLPELDKLANQYKDQGLVVFGIPSNDFGAEEPGDDPAIQKYYADMHVSFPLMAKSEVCGKNELPVYSFLTAPPPAKGKAATDAAKPPTGTDVHWSFTKFLVTRDGVVGARFEPDVTPDSPEFRIAIDKALAGKLKPGSKSREAPNEAAEDEDDDGGL